MIYEDKNQQPYDVEMVVTEYEEKESIYQMFSCYLKKLIKELLDGEIDTFIIESRVKTPKSFRIKIEDPKKNYSDPLTEVTDLVGVRVIAFSEEEVEKTQKIIEENLTIDTENSHDKKSQLNTEQFGYLSKHYIVSCTEERIKLEENKHFRGLKAEIQIRTVLQHAWASVYHKHFYKNEFNESYEVLKRKLYQTSALLEVADNIFQSVIDEKENIKKKSIQAIREENFSLLFDNFTLHEYIFNAHTPRDIINSIAEVETEEIRVIPEPRFSDVVNLTKTLKFLKIDTLQKFDDYLENNVNLIQKFFELLIKNIKKNNDIKHVFISIPRERLFSLVALLKLEDEDLHNVTLPYPRSSTLGKAVFDTYSELKNQNSN